MPEVSVPSPDLIEVTAEFEEDVAADKVDLFVEVEGSSLFTGRAALSKAHEVRALVDELAAVGIAEDHIFVEAIDARTTSGIFSKSSSARYSLRVRCRILDRLGDVLGAITGQKNVRMGRMDWGYDESPAAAARRLASCAAIAKQKAQAVAEALGVRLGGPHRMSEIVPKLPEPALLGGAPGTVPVMASRASMSQADLGLAVAHHRKVTTRLSASFKVER